MSAAVASSALASRPLMTISQPAAASACAQARPSPRLEAHTMALRPAIPRSTGEGLLLRRGPPDASGSAAPRLYADPGGIGIPGTPASRLPLRTFPPKAVVPEELSLGRP